MQTSLSADEALSIVVRLDREGRKMLLKKLMEEMNSKDAEEVLADEGYTAG